MGYYSEFSLEVDGSKEEKESIISAFLQENEGAAWALNIDGTSRQWDKWYEVNEDMINLSKKHPKRSFIIQIMGQILGDMKRIHYKEGELHDFESGVISYPEFNPDLLQEYQAKDCAFSLEEYHQLTLRTDYSTYTLCEILKKTYKDQTFSLNSAAYKIDISGWTNHESCIVEFSKSHPETVFNLTYDIDFQEHEEVYNENDLSRFWIKYIKNGKIYTADAFWDWIYN